MQAIDNALFRVMHGWGFWPQVDLAAREMTLYGGARLLVPLSVLAGVWLFARGQRRRAIMFLGVTLGGRLLVELLKLAFDRHRPIPEGTNVEVFSQSFPSGHAANSMVVYLAMALIIAPLITTGKWPVRAAIALSILIGLTRPILGVHWPSDILAGWALGVGWTLSLVWLLDHWVRGDLATAPRSLIR